ncbi:MAG TPA: tetratricopeptide repeat protein [Pirellulales bacterium]|nr:tetratricopeptide repeat protein [Pirellulales bacterium]
MPTSEELYSEADKLKDSGDLAGAAKKLDELLAQDPRFALAHSALAVICGRLGRHDEAVAHAVKVCEIEPNDPFSFTALSVTCQRAGRIMEAEEAMARARMMQGR